MVAPVDVVDVDDDGPVEVVDVAGEAEVGGGVMEVVDRTSRVVVLVALAGSFVMGARTAGTSWVGGSGSGRTQR